MTVARTSDTQCIHRAGCPKPDVCKWVGHCTSMTATDLSLEGVTSAGPVGSAHDPRFGSPPPHSQPCTCPACAPSLWAAGIKGSRMPETLFSKKEVPESLVKALAEANGICSACFGKKVLPALIQWTDGRPCSIEERACPLCQP